MGSDQGLLALTSSILFTSVVPRSCILSSAAVWVRAPAFILSALSIAVSALLGSFAPSLDGGLSVSLAALSSASSGTVPVSILYIVAPTAYTSDQEP